eukprot:gene10449-10608_t
MIQAAQGQPQPPAALNTPVEALGAQLASSSVPKAAGDAAITAATLQHPFQEAVEKGSGSKPAGDAVQAGLTPVHQAAAHAAAPLEGSWRNSFGPAFALPPAGAPAGGKQSSRALSPATQTTSSHLDANEGRRQLEGDAAALRAQVKHLQAELAAERQRRIAAEEGLGRFLQKLQELEPGAADPEHIQTAKRQVRLPTPAAAADERGTGSRDSEDAGASKAGGAAGDTCLATKQHQQLPHPDQQPLPTLAVFEAPAACPNPDVGTCAGPSGPAPASPSRGEAAVPAAGAEGNAGTLGDGAATSVEALPNVAHDSGYC